MEQKKHIKSCSHRIIKLANKMSIYILCQSFGNFVVVINVGNFLKRNRHNDCAQRPQQPLQAANFNNEPNNRQIGKNKNKKHLNKEIKYFERILNDKRSSFGRLQGKRKQKMRVVGEESCEKADSIRNKNE